MARFLARAVRGARAVRPSVLEEVESIHLASLFLKKSVGNFTKNAAKTTFQNLNPFCPIRGHKNTWEISQNMRKGEFGIFSVAHTTDGHRSMSFFSPIWTIGIVLGRKLSLFTSQIPLRN